MSSGKSVFTMKKEVAAKHPEHPLMTEEQKLKETFSPGKLGGAFALPLGGRIIVPDGIFVKKDIISCRVVPPSERWRHSPNFPDERLLSEILILSGSSRMKKYYDRRRLAMQDTKSMAGSEPESSAGEKPWKQVILVLPYYQYDYNHLELNVKGMWKDEFSWVDVGFIGREGTDKPMVELQVEKMGMFAVTYRLKTDQFEIDSNGGLVHSRLNRTFTIRFPKKSIDTNINYNLRIEPVPEEQVQFCKEYFPQDCQDLLVASQFIDLLPDLRCDFRRPATIKMPLPDGVEVEGETSQEILVLHKEQGSWHTLDTKYKFTRFSVSVDIKNPSRFIVVKTKPGRQKKMQTAVAVLEQRANWVIGQVNVFLSFIEQSWMGVVEAYPQPMALTKIAARKEQGFTVVHKVEVPVAVSKSMSLSRRTPILKEYTPIKFDGIEIYDGLTWTVEMADDLQFSPESDLSENAHLHVFQNVPESYRRFRMVPLMEEERALTGVVVLRPVGVTDPELRDQLTLSFNVDISAEALRNYHYVPEPEPIPEHVKPNLNLHPAGYFRSAEMDTLSEPKPAPVKVRTYSVSALERLSQANRRISTPDLDKETKVISGKNLMILSKVVNEGLTLAVHLDLPDSTITGIVFDALSNNRSMSEVGYRILLYWKRTRKDKRDCAVHNLINSLRSMGKHGVADIMEERHRDTDQASQARRR